MLDTDPRNYYGLENEVTGLCTCISPSRNKNGYLYEDATSLHSTQEWLEEQCLKVKIFTDFAMLEEHGTNTL